MPSTTSWGVGEIADIPPMAAWLRECGLDMLQLLPLNEMTTGQNSPYGAMSALALDPIYISVARVPEFRALGGVECLAAGTRDRLRAAQAARSVQYQEVRRIKQEALEAAYRQFLGAERRSAPRVRQFETFRREQAWWLHEYALFRALHERFEARAWTEWPDGLRDREPAALQRARVELHERTLFFEYLQWIASEQWQEARRDLAGVSCSAICRSSCRSTAPTCGRVRPSSISARRWVFRRTRSARRDSSGACRSIAGTSTRRTTIDGCANARAAARTSTTAAASITWSALPHLRDSARRHAVFLPADPARQIAQGERLMKIFCSAGPRVIAEDLGTVPDYVRQSLARLGLPGFKVLRWERDWNAPGQPFRAPASYPAVSVAMTGTHDTEPMRVWWEHAPAEERAAALQIPGLDVSGAWLDSPFSAALRDAFLRVLFHAGSDLLMLPIQDVFGWADRINVPATVGADNWTYRLPWPVDRFSDTCEAREAAARLRRWAEASGRAPDSNSHVPVPNAHLAR